MYAKYLFFNVDVTLKLVVEVVDRWFRLVMVVSTKGSPFMRLCMPWVSSMNNREETEIDTSQSTSEIYSQVCITYITINFRNMQPGMYCIYHHQLQKHTARYVLYASPSTSGTCSQVCIVYITINFKNI